MLILMYRWIGSHTSYLTIHKKMHVKLPLLTIRDGTMGTHLSLRKVAAAAIRLTTSYKLIMIPCGIDGMKVTYRASELNNVYEEMLKEP